MSAPRNPGIYIGMMSLVMTAVLAGSSLIAPCIEIGFFWTAAATALAVACYARRTSVQIGQSGMLMVYCLLAGALTLMVTSITDIANFSLLGKRHDAETGILLGALVAYCTVTTIAIRCSRRFPAAFAWWTVVALLAAWVVGWGLTESLSAEYSELIISTGIIAVLAVFISLCRCKQDLSDRQYLAALGSIVVFIYWVVPLSSDNTAACLLANMLICLTCILYLYERQAAAAASRIIIAMVLFLIFGDVAKEVVEAGIDASDTSIGIPAALLGIIIILRVRNMVEQIQRGLYWTVLFTFGLLSGISVMPDAFSDDLLNPLLYVLGFFCIAIAWYLRSDWLTHSTWGGQFRQLSAFLGSSLALLLTLASITMTLFMLTVNAGPARLVALLESTPYWPGDKAFIRLAFNDESLWHEEIRESAKNELKLSSYIKGIRPAADRFSGIAKTDNEKNDELGRSEGIGVQWETARNQMTLVRVNRDSPAGKAGLSRGDRLLAINGIMADELNSTDSIKWQKLYSNWKTGTTVSLDVLTRSGTKRKVKVAVGNNIQDPPMCRIINSSHGEKIGYLYLHSFTAAQFDDIEKHFLKFKRAGVSKLVLDLRYNSGGNVGDLVKLGSLIVSQEFEGKQFVRLEHGQRYEDRDEAYPFKRLPQSMSADRVVVLTTEDTCSASEAVINGLRPYIPVTTVGATTCGKPYLMELLEFGDMTLFPVTGRILNSRGDAAYDKGIRPDYTVKDDTTRQLGDPREAMLKKALEVMGNKI